MTELEKVRERFKGDRYATYSTGIVIDEITPKNAKCSLAITDNHKNAVGSVMGGVMFTLADFTFAVAANHDESGIVVTNNSQITFLRAAQGEMLYSESRLIKDGRVACTYEILIRDDTGKEVALAVVNGMHIKGK